MTRGKFLLKVRISRKSFFPIYLMVVIVLLLLIYLHYLGFKIEKSTIIVTILFLAIVIKFTEIHRIRNWWAITDSSVIQSLGLLNKNIMEVEFPSISNLELNQPFYKRFFNYGDVKIILFLNDSSIKVHNIDNPEEFLAKVQDIMAKNKKGNNYESK